MLVHPDLWVEFQQPLDRTRVDPSQTLEHRSASAEAARLSQLPYAFLRVRSLWPLSALAQMLDRVQSQYFSATPSSIIVGPRRELSLRRLCEQMSERLVLSHT